MAAPTMNPQLIKTLHDRAVAQLVKAHRQRTDEPLILAVRFNLNDPKGDIYLLEVLGNFPGGDDDELMATQFGPSANLVIVGNLHLVLGSPAQVREAIKKGDSIIKTAKGGIVVYANRSAEATNLRKALAL